MFLISLCADEATPISLFLAFSTASSYCDPPNVDPSNLSLAALMSASLRSCACFNLTFCCSICLSASFLTESFSNSICAYSSLSAFCSRTIRLSTRTSSPFINLAISSDQRTILLVERASLAFSVSICATCSSDNAVCSMCALDKNPKIPMEVININMITPAHR